MRLHHAAVVCGSRETAERFYRGVLGLNLLKTSRLSLELSEKIFQKRQECEFLLFGNGEVVIEVFIDGQASERTASFEHLCLEVAEREAFMDRCRAADLKVNLIPKGESLLAFLEDYDGNLFEIKEYAP